MWRIWSDDWGVSCSLIFSKVVIIPWQISQCCNTDNIVFKLLSRWYHDLWERILELQGNVSADLLMVLLVNSWHNDSSVPPPEFLLSTLTVLILKSVESPLLLFSLFALFLLLSPLSPPSLPFRQFANPLFLSFHHSLFYCPSSSSLPFSWHWCNCNYQLLTCFQTQTTYKTLFANKHFVWLWEK